MREIQSIVKIVRSLFFLFFENKIPLTCDKNSNYRIRTSIGLNSKESVRKINFWNTLKGYRVRLKECFTYRGIAVLLSNKLDVCWKYNTVKLLCLNKVEEYFMYNR